MARQRGVTPSLFKLLASNRVRSSSSYWKLLRDALLIGWFNRGSLIEDYVLHSAASRRMVAPEIRNSAVHHPDLFQPWFANGSSLLPGKQMHAFFLFSSTRFYDPFQLPTDPEFTEPLHSQPLVDVCLKIPTYVHSYNGRHRASGTVRICTPPTQRSGRETMEECSRSTCKRSYSPQSRFHKGNSCWTVCYPRKGS